VPSNNKGSTVEIAGDELASLRKRLSEAEEKLAGFEREKDEFLAMLAHELRNPLGPIRSAVEIMRMVGPHDAALDTACELIARQVDQLSQIVDELPAAQAPAAEPPRQSVGRHMPRRIVVVDDNKDAADSMAMLLRLKGHEVHVAYDGLSGVATALETKSDCVIADIGLPGIDGFEVAKRLRSHDPDHTMTIIALTGYGQLEDKARSEQAGFDHYIVKPVAQNVLEDLIRR
jgi:CheY-like chemotaxis protein